MKNGESPGGQSQALLLKADEVADLLAISVRSVWRLASRGELPPPIEIGRSKRWRRDDIEKFVGDRAAA